MPCLGVWRAYTWAKRHQRAWTTYLRAEWGIDAANGNVEQVARSVDDELHAGLLVVAMGMSRLTSELVRAIAGALRSPGIADPCASASDAIAQTVQSQWIQDAVLLRTAPQERQRGAAGMSLAAHILARISLGRSRRSTKVRGRPGKRLSAALHELWHDDLSVPCLRAHDAALIREVLPLVWSEPTVQEVSQLVDAAHPGREALLGRITNRLTYRIIREAKARRQRQTDDGVTVRERREVRLSRYIVADSPDFLEELVAHEDAECDQRVFEEVLDLIPLLPPRQRQIAELKLVKRLSHSQIAARLGLTKGGSKSNWFKARRFLASLYKKRHGDFGEIAKFAGV